MGYHHTLRCIAIIKPEYIQYMTRDTFDHQDDWFYYIDEEDNTICNSMNEKYKNTPKEQKDLIVALHSSSLFNDGGFHPKMDGDKCIIDTWRNVSRYCGDIIEDFKFFMVNVIAPISTIILHCEIQEEPYVGPDIFTYYTDAEVREFRKEPDVIDRGRQIISNKEYKSYFG